MRTRGTSVTASSRLGTDGHRAHTPLHSLRATVHRPGSRSGTCASVWSVSIPPLSALPTDPAPQKKSGECSSLTSGSQCSVVAKCSVAGARIGDMRGSTCPSRHISAACASRHLGGMRVSACVSRHVRLGMRVSTSAPWHARLGMHTSAHMYHVAVPCARADTHTRHAWKPAPAAISTGSSACVSVSAEVKPSRSSPAATCTWPSTCCCAPCSSRPPCGPAKQRSK